ncbi:MAG: hypothetical protein H8E55_15525 [Pelagibacterales bacterium]|nr:hypothetical protein [Pelagibacterales bacterium]
MDLPYLPQEILNMIIYKYNAIETPSSTLIKNYWAYMNKEYRVFEDLVLETSIPVILNADNDGLTVGTISTFNFISIDYPRIYFKTIE